MDTGQSKPAEKSPHPRAGRPLPVEGQRISWGTLGGQRHAGTVVEMDSNVAIVQCDDGVRRAVEC